MATPVLPYTSSRRAVSQSDDDTMIGPFKKLESIGKGSFALVYRGIHVVRTLRRLRTSLCDLH
jgi:serine/threonine-protein kinase ULK2